MSQRNNLFKRGMDILISEGIQPARAREMVDAAFAEKIEESLLSELFISLFWTPQKTQGQKNTQNSR